MLPETSVIPPKTKKPKKLSTQELEAQRVSDAVAAMGVEAYKKVWGIERVAIWRPMLQEQIVNFTNAGIVLQQKQWEIAATCRLCDLTDGPKAVMVAGGRGAAKTHGIMAVEFIDDCQRIPGLKCLILRKISSSNKQQVADFLKKLLGNVKHQYREYRQTIEFENDSLIILGNFKDEKDIDKYLGLEYDLIHLVESNQLTPTKRINILSCLRTNKTNWRPRSYEDTNPGGIAHVSNKMLFVEPWKREQSGGEKQTETRYIHCTIDDNQFVDKGYKQYLEKLVGWQREAWLHGSWEFMAGAFFSNFHPDIHVYPNKQTDLNLKTVTRWFGGLDYGFSHPTAFMLGCETENGDIFCVRSYGEAGLTIEEHSANIKDVLALFHLDVSDLEFIAAGRDCFRVDKDGSTVATEYQERGIMLNSVQIDRVNAWSQVAQRFGDISHQIRPTCFIHQSCGELILQIQSAQCDPKRPNDVLKMNCDPETLEGGDDELEAFRNMIVMAYSSLLSSARPLQMGAYQSENAKQLTVETVEVEGQIVLDCGAIISSGELQTENQFAKF
jgi:hypothetical protein